MFHSNKKNKSDFRVLLYSAVDKLNISDLQQLNLVKDILTENNRDSNQILLGKYHSSFFQLIKKIYNLIQALVFMLPKYNIIHIFIPSQSFLLISLIIPFFISRIFGLKIIVSYNDAKILTYGSFLRNIVLRILKECDEITVNNSAIKSMLEKHDNNAIYVNHVKLFYQSLNHVNVQFKKTCKIVPKILVDFSGNPSQNLYGIIKAFRIIKQKYPRTELNIIGNHNRIMNIYENLNLKNENGVSILENSNEKEVQNLFDENDIYLNNTRDEYLPPSMMTALQSGIPIIAAENKSMTALISSGLSQFIHIFKDHIELADKLIDLVESNHPIIPEENQSSEKLSFCSSRNISNSWKKLYFIQNK